MNGSHYPSFHSSHSLELEHDENDERISNDPNYAHQTIKHHENHVRYRTFDIWTIINRLHRCVIKRFHYHRSCRWFVVNRCIFIIRKCWKCSERQHCFSFRWTIQTVSQSKYITKTQLIESHSKSDFCNQQVVCSKPARRLNRLRKRWKCNTNEKRSSESCESERSFLENESSEEGIKKVCRFLQLSKIFLLGWLY